MAFPPAILAPDLLHARDDAYCIFSCSPTEGGEGRILEGSEGSPSPFLFMRTFQGKEQDRKGS